MSIYVRTDGHLDSFKVLVILNSTSVNNLIHVFDKHRNISVEYMSRNETSFRRYGKQFTNVDVPTYTPISVMGFSYSILGFRSVGDSI